MKNLAKSENNVAAATSAAESVMAAAGVESDSLDMSAESEDTDDEADADGQYVRAVRTILDSLGHTECGILAQLESEGNIIRRMPFTEMMRFLWKDNGKQTENIQTEAVVAALKKNGVRLFSDDMAGLFVSAQSALDRFAGNHGRYRFAKAAEMGESADAVLMMAPRYENTAVVLQLSGVQQFCRAPLFEVSLDGDWDENSWSRLRSFLYYC